jgi:hypothetical protein
MPIVNQWFLEKRVLLSTFSGELSLADLTRSTEEIRAAIDQSEGQFLHCIGDLGGLTKIPTNLKAVTDATQGAMRHPHFGWMIVYNMPNQVIKFFGDIATRFFQVRYRVLDTQHEALDFLNQVDSTLPPLRPIAEQRLRDQQRL